MKWLSSLQKWISNQDSQQFSIFLSIVLSAVLVLMGIGFYSYYTTVGKLTKRMRQINTLRQETGSIVQTYEHVRAQRAEVDTMLAKDPNFKILGYTTDLLAKLNLSAKQTTAQRDLDKRYQETTVTAQLFGITMRQLVELLKQIEQNKRVYTKYLEISAAKNKNIDVTLTIGTLQLKTNVSE